MTLVNGFVTNVWTADAGSELLADLPMNTSSFQVADSYDFNEEGGALTIDGSYRRYASCDHDTDTIYLESGDAIPHYAGDDVLVSPKTQVKWAMVDHEDDDEGTQAMIPFSMRDRFDTGVRVDGVDGDDEREAVVISDETGRWEIKSVTDEIGVITGTKFQTAADGNRIEMKADTSGGVIKFYTGDATETAAGAINPDEIGPSTTHQPVLRLITGVTTNCNVPAEIDMYAGKSGVIGGVTVRMPASDSVFSVGNPGLPSAFTVSGAGGVEAAGVILGDGDVRATASLWSINYTDTTNGANVYIGAGGKIYHSTSLTKEKIDQKAILLKDALKLLNLEPKTWLDRTEIEENGGKKKGLHRIAGLIAEDVAEHAPTLADYSPEGELRGIHGDRVGAMLIPIIRDQQRRIDELEARLSRLEKGDGR